MAETVRRPRPDGDPPPPSPGRPGPPGSQPPSPGWPGPPPSPDSLAGPALPPPRRGAVDPRPGFGPVPAVDPAHRPRTVGPPPGGDAAYRRGTVDPPPEAAATGLTDAARLFAESVSAGLIDPAIPGIPGVPAPEAGAAGAEDGRSARARLRRIAVVAALVAAGGAALACAVLVLVVLRWPERAAAPSTVAPMDAATARALVADRVLSVATWIEYVATLLVLGGALFRTFVSRPAMVGRGVTERLLVGAALAGMASCVGSLPLRALVLADGGLGAVGDLDVIEVVATSRFGDAACLRMLALALFALLLVRPPRGWERRVRIIRPEGTVLALVSIPRRLAEGIVVVAVAAVAVASFLLVGHPQASEPRGALMAAQAGHVVAAAVWFGGGVVLAIEIHRQRRHDTARCTAQTVARFSVLAGGAVALAAVTGVGLAASQLDSPEALASTAYGRALAVKTALAAVVVALGAYNHYRLVPAIVGGDDSVAWRRLGRTAAAEGLVIAVGVLVATAAMTSGGF
jgi:putative copper export protein